MAIALFGTLPKIVYNFTANWVQDAKSLHGSMWCLSFQTDFLPSLRNLAILPYLLTFAHPYLYSLLEGIYLSSSRQS